MAVVEDCSSPADYLEDELDGKVNEKKATLAATQKEVCKKCFFEDNDERLIKKCCDNVFDKALISHYEHF